METPDPSEATWEDSREFKLWFPDFITGLEDKPDFEEGSIDAIQPTQEVQQIAAEKQNRPNRIIRRSNQFQD